jgi:hypothetical protein
MGAIETYIGGQVEGNGLDADEVIAAWYTCWDLEAYLFLVYGMVISKYVSPC